MLQNGATTTMLPIQISLKLILKGLNQGCIVLCEMEVGSVKCGLAVLPGVIAVNQMNLRMTLVFMLLSPDKQKNIS